MSFTLPPKISPYFYARSRFAQQRLTNLSLLCECLAVVEPYTEDLPKGLIEDSVDWRGLFWLAGECLVTPSLAGALQCKGLIDLLSNEVQDYLHTLQSLNRTRNQSLREQLVIITDALNRIGIQPVLLKGAIILTSGQYPGAEDRVVGDLDLLISDQQMEVATAAIIGLGYQVDQESRRWALPSQLKHHHHGFPLLHPSLPVKVELHHRILHHQGDDAQLRQQAIFQLFSFDEGPTALIPDIETRVLHNMLHCQITDRHYARKLINLRQLLEFALLTQNYEGSLDIPHLLKRLHPKHHVILAIYWAQAERWLKSSYPGSLPRSSNETIQLWLLEKGTTNPGWYSFFTFVDWLSRLPGRLPNLFKKLWLMPEYFPVKIRSVLSGQ